MNKTKYYANINGEEKLVRTSKNEYHFFWRGRCSKTIEGCQQEKNSRISQTQRMINYYNRVLTNEKELEKESKHWRESTDETARRYTEYLKSELKYLEEAKAEPIHELYTK